MFGFGKKKKETKKAMPAPKKTGTKTTARKPVAKTVVKPEKHTVTRKTSTPKKMVSTAKKRSIRAGDFATIHSAKATGHKGSIGKCRKNGKIDAFTLTHAKYTRGRKNIELKENPQKEDTRKSYVVRKVNRVTRKNVGRKHDDLKIKNPTDKSIMRKLRTNAKKKK